MEFTPEWIEAFWDRVDRSGGLDACWPWTRGRNSHGGYGRLSIAGRDDYAHRAAYLITHGEIPDELPHVLHKCDNPPCCNPSHLFAGTNHDNILDMFSKGRATGQMERSVPAMIASVTKVTPEMCVEIRLLRATGLTNQSVGDLFGIAACTVSRVVNRQRRYENI